MFDKNKSKLYTAWVVVFVMGTFLYYGHYIQRNNMVSDPAINNHIATNKQYGIPEDNQYAVSAGHPLAVKVGMDVLSKGGNAVDAAIAVSYTLSVVQPFASGIGGGGVMLVYPADKQKPTVYDYEATSPKDGRIPERYIGVPGFVKAMEEVHQDFGSVEMSGLLEPAVKIAEDGFKVDKVLHNVLITGRYRLTGRNLLGEFFPQGNAVKVGALLKQPELASTLKEIQKEGSRAFYEGSIADSIRKEVYGLSKADLSDYQVAKKEPVSGRYRGYEIFSAPPPFSGITLIQIMELAEKLNIDSLDENDNNIHLYTDLVNEAYKKRSKDIADPAFMRVDYNKLLDKSYLEVMLKDMSLDDYIGDESTYNEDSEDTTHFVVVDKNGMMVSGTNSLSSWFGSGVYIRGFFLNNHLKNLNQVKGSVNSWSAGKHPRSFISPTIVAKDGKPVLGIGSPGGRKIPTMITQVVFKILKDNKDPQRAVDEPRLYILQNYIYTEGNFLNAAKKKVLKTNGYQVINNASPLSYGAVNCLYYDYANNRIYGGADKRRGGTWQVNSTGK